MCGGGEERGGGSENARVYTESHLGISTFRICVCGRIFIIRTYIKNSMRTVRYFIRGLTFKRAVGPAQLLGESEKLANIQRSIVKTGTG
jgi:hypothetical protein